MLLTARPLVGRLRPGQERVPGLGGRTLVRLRDRVAAEPGTSQGVVWRATASGDPSEEGASLAIRP